MKITESFATAIGQVFAHTTFVNRTEEVVMGMCHKSFKGSDTMALLPPIPKLEVRMIDDTHDVWRIVFEDITLEYVVTWTPSTILKGQFVFTNIEVVAK